MVGFRKLALSACIITFSFYIFGCASSGPFGKYYKNNSRETYTQTKEVEVLDFSESSLKNMIDKGYLVIGESRFNAPLHGKEEAIKQAQKVGANIVLLNYKHTGNAPMMINLPGSSIPTTIARFDHYAVFLRRP
jgi:hypothetical protein